MVVEPSPRGCSPLMSPILKDDSPLLRLPDGLPVGLVQLLDGIRYGISTADLAYQRLTETMMSVFADKTQLPSVHNLATAAFLDAWSMIDAVNRLRRLLPKAYNKDRTPALEPFLLDTEEVRVLRNGIHHAEERIEKAEPWSMPGVPPMWGTIECLAPGADATSARYAALTPGTRTFKWASSAVASSPYPNAPVDHICITAFGARLSLTRIFSVVDRLARGLEEVAPAVPPGRGFVDMLMTWSVPYSRSEQSGQQ